MALSYAHGATDTPLRAETIGELWNAVAAAHGDREALVSREQSIRWTYAELDAQVERCARGLLALGVARGARVGIWSPNNAEWVVVVLAKIAVPSNSRRKRKRPAPRRSDRPLPMRRDRFC